MTPAFFSILQFIGSAAAIALLVGLGLSFVRKAHGMAFWLLGFAIVVNIGFSWFFSIYFVYAAWGVIPALIALFLGPITPLVGMGVGAAYFGSAAFFQVLGPLVIALIPGWRMTAMGKSS
jgi:hypothetical protein